MTSGTLLATQPELVPSWNGRIELVCTMNLLEDDLDVRINKKDE